YLFFFSSRRRHTRFSRDWSSDVCSSDLRAMVMKAAEREGVACAEGRLSIETLELAEEVFLTSSIREVMPVVRFDDRVIGRGVPEIGRASCRERVWVSVGGGSVEE